MTSGETTSFRDLLVWQKGIELVKQIYQVTRTFPADEKFSLSSLMRRAAVSIPSNVAEGQARHTTGEFVQFVSHAEGSLAELYTQLILTVELGYCSKTRMRAIFQLMAELRKMLNAMRRTLVEKSSGG